MWHTQHLHEILENVADIIEKIMSMDVRVFVFHSTNYTRNVHFDIHLHKFRARNLQIYARNPLQRDSILIFYASVMSCVCVFVCMLRRVQLFSTRSSANIMYSLLSGISAANIQYSCLLALAALTF